MTSLSSLDVADLADVTYRQLDYWVRCGLIPGMDPDGAGSGIHRRWSIEQAEHLRRMAGLVHAGMDPRAAAGLAARGDGTHEAARGVYVTLGRPCCWATEYLAVQPLDLLGAARRGTADR